MIEIKNLIALLAPHSKNENQIESRYAEVNDDKTISIKNQVGAEIDSIDLNVT